MKVIDRQAEIQPKQIRPHPQNPRKDLGDLEELEDSIRANGIFQNLTVVEYIDPENPDEDTDEFVCVIGHRRLEAAKRAGLMYVPCMIVAMTEKEQIATMLLENMQRNDLTVYEQAQGFQTMLDLGETQDTIAEKTGFSKTTIRHRLKLLELDKEEFEKSQERQPSISDYIELEKISDPKLKSKALSKIGTSDFAWTVTSAINEEKRAKIKAEWLSLFDECMEMLDFKEKSKRKQLGYYYIGSEITDSQKVDIRELAESTIITSYYIYDGYQNVYIVGDELEKPVKKEDDKTEAERRKKQQEIEELEAQMQEMRLDFVRQYSGKISKVYRYYLTEPDIEDIVYGDAAKLLGIKPAEDEDYEIDSLLESDAWVQKVEYKPESVMLALLATIYENSYGYSGHSVRVHDYNNSYSPNGSLQHWYDILKDVGYKMSSVEKKLMNGTHEIFREGEEK